MHMFAIPASDKSQRLGRRTRTAVSRVAARSALAALVLSGTTVALSGQAARADGGLAVDPISVGIAPTDLGTLGGASSRAMAIDGTIVVGGADTASGQEHAFAMDLSAAIPVMRDLGTIGGEWSRATMVSGHVVVGIAGLPGSVGQYDWENGSRTHVFSYDLTAAQPAMRDLGALAPLDDAGSQPDTWPLAMTDTTVVGYAGNAGFAVDISAGATPRLRDLGGFIPRDVSGTLAVGYTQPSSTYAVAQTWDLSVPGGQAVDIPMPTPTYYSGASAVSGNLVTGGRAADPLNRDFRAFLYDVGSPLATATDLTVGPGVSNVGLIHISGSVVIGNASFGGSSSHAMRYDTARQLPVVEDLGTLGGRSSNAEDSDGSVIVGDSNDTGDTTFHAFAYDASAVTPTMQRLGGLGGCNYWYGLTCSGSFVRGQRSVSAAIVAGDAYPAATCTLAYVFTSCPAHAVVWRLPVRPADGNGDGVIDSLQPAGTPAGAFVDASLTPVTSGSVSNANGLAVTVTDAADPTDGVQIAVGPGTGKATLTVCGGFTLKVSAGSTVIITCGSVKVHTVTGSADVVLSPTTMVTIAAGATGKVSTSGGVATVVNLGTTPGVTVTNNGVVLPIAPGAAPAPIDTTPPTITVSGSTAYTVDQAVLLTCSATDDSGIASTNCPTLVSAPAQSFPLGVSTVTATATDKAGNTGTQSASFTVSVTSTSLCRLTYQMVQGSSAYAALKPVQRTAPNARVAEACQYLSSAASTPKQKSALIGKYMSAVQALVPVYLTAAQAQKLSAYASAL